GRDRSWISKRYRAMTSLQPLLELALGAYLTSAIYFALDKGVWFSLPFLLLFQFGFFYVGVMSLLQGRLGTIARFFRRNAICSGLRPPPVAGEARSSAAAPVVE
ncbi:MAG: hypothetical protein ACJ79O_07675, partial [Myxococcales bacterium]